MDCFFPDRSRPSGFKSSMKTSSEDLPSLENSTGNLSAPSLTQIAGNASRLRSELESVTAENKARSYAWPKLFTLAPSWSFEARCHGSVFPAFAVIRQRQGDARNGSRSNRLRNRRRHRRCVRPGEPWRGIGRRWISSFHRGSHVSHPCRDWKGQ